MTGMDQSPNSTAALWLVVPRFIGARVVFFLPRPHKCGHYEQRHCCLLPVLLLQFICATIAVGQTSQEKPPAKRYAVEPDLDTFPQTTPKDTLASAMRAVQRDRVDYLLAQLADPEFVDN